MELLDDDLVGASQEFDSKTITKINDLKLEVNEKLKALKQGRIILGALAGLTIVSLIIGYFYNPYEVSTTELLLEAGIMVALYGTLAWFLPRNPKMTLIAGLIIYLLYNALAAVVDLSTLYRGYIIKFIVLFGFARAIAAAFQIDTIFEKLHRLGISRAETDPVVPTMTEIRRTPRKKK